MKKILAIDDERDTLELIKLILNSNGYEVVLSESGKNAIELIENHNPNLVLLDIKMPEMSGWEVFKIIKDKYPDLPVVFLTVVYQGIYVLTGKYILKADDYIVKPFEKEKFLEKINSIINKN